MASSSSVGEWLDKQVGINAVMELWREADGGASSVRKQARYLICFKRGVECEESADHICKALQKKRWSKRLQSAAKRLFQNSKISKIRFYHPFIQAKSEQLHQNSQFITAKQQYQFTKSDFRIRKRKEDLKSEDGGDGEAATVGEGGVGGRTIEAAAIEGKKQQTSEEAAIEGSNAGEGLSGSNVADGRKQCGRWKEAMASKVCGPMEKERERNRDRRIALACSNKIEAFSIDFSSSSSTAFSIDFRFWIHYDFFSFRRLFKN
ncbi:hypothetical protein LXL04_018811 [Taraxacum kok-saghyz]